MTPTRTDHDRCLRTAIHRRAELTDAEHLTLNIVAGAWAAQLTVTRRQLTEARAILARLETTNRDAPA
jgi:hypothetical protein